MNNSKKIGYFSILATVLIWGISFISTKASLDYFNPISLAFWRFFLAVIALYIIKKNKYPKVRMDKEDRKIFFAGGISGVFLYFMFENYGMEYLTASTASILIAVIPVLTMISETIINKEKVSVKKIISVTLSVIGVILIVGFDPQRDIVDMLIGSALILLASISWVVYTFLSKPLYKKYTTITITYYQTLIGFVFFGLLMPFNNSNIFNLPLGIYIHVIYLGVLSSAAAYLLFIYALETLEATVCNIFINLIPVVTVSAGIIFLNEKITLLQGLGAVIIISSILMLTYKKKEPPIREF
ncbi:MAG: DMT family transporter [Bacillota bacterium]|nr:DMT family transporter [Bacillota bacterium]